MTSRKAGFVDNYVLPGFTYLGLVALCTKVGVEKTLSPYRKKKPISPAPLPSPVNTLPPATIAKVQTDPPKAFPLPSVAELQKAFKGLDEYSQLASAFQLLSNDESEPSRKALFRDAAYLTQTAGNIFRTTSLARVADATTFPLDATQFNLLKKLFDPVSSRQELVSILSSLEKVFEQNQLKRMKTRLEHTASALRSAFNLKK